MGLVGMKGQQARRYIAKLQCPLSRKRHSREKKIKQLLEVSMMNLQK